MTDRRTVVEHNHAAIERIEGLLESGEVVDERVPDAYLLLGSKFRRIGMLYVGEEPEAARKAMRAAAEYTLTGIRKRRERLRSSGDRRHYESEPFELRDAVHAAALARDDDLAGEVLAAVDDLDERYLDDHPATAAWYHYVKMHAALYRGETDVQRETLDRLRDAAERLAGSPNDLDELFDGIVTVFEGFGADDPGAVADGIDDVQAHHRGALAERGEGTARSFQALDATVLLSMADQLGIAPDR